MVKRARSKEVVVDKREENLRATLNATFGTPDGKRALRFLYEFCGYEDSLTALTATGQLDSVSVVHNAAHREVYRALRKKINPEILKEVEFYQPEETHG